MRIHYFSNSIIPSTQANSVHVMKMCDAFSNNGAEVTLFGKKSKLDLSHLDILKEYDVKNYFDLKLLNQHYKKKFGVIEYLMRLSKIYNSKQNPDIFYGRHIHSLLILKNKGIPLFYEAHHLPITEIRRKMESWLFNSKNFKKLIVISNSLKKDYLLKFSNLNEKDILVLHDGADIREFRSKPAFYDSQFQVGYIGQLYKGKGVELIIELANLMPDIKFNIIGGNKKQVYEWEYKLKNTHNLRFWGHVPFNKTEEYRQAMDVLIAPYQKQVMSKGGDEISKWMSPLKLFEYMASKKPIITSNHEVITEFLDTESAILCDPSNINEWRDAILLVKNNKNLRDKLVDNAFNKLKNNYTWSRRTEILLNEFNNN
ncbi:glycosyltransferase family 4 protein [Amphibacillus sediminis]|uniref:glycosyltransferase family 4 protein n=1 Tax=Amphibacillus sediminis TaxID=360185 RepID=UPI0008307F0D|nr:glycosyltransferase family 4 protein [Amphibacillus sediminis]